MAIHSPYTANSRETQNCTETSHRLFVNDIRDLPSCSGTPDRSTSEKGRTGTTFEDQSRALRFWNTFTYRTVDEAILTNN